MADKDQPKAAGSTPAPTDEKAEAKRAPSWVSEDPFPPKVTLDPSLAAELAEADQPAPTTSAPAAPPSPTISTTSPAAPSAEHPAGARARPTSGRRFLGLPWWGWLLALMASLVVIFLVADLRNRNRYVIVCEARRVELQQGRRLPFPFGLESVGGPEYKPVTVASDTDCRQQAFGSEEDAARALLELLLGQVRAALSNPAGSNLKEARQQLQQALLLTALQRGRRKEAESMLAELSYREGRAGLARAENELRLALSRFQEAQKLDGRRFEDLEEWITHLEEMLRSIAPSPFSSPPRLGPAPGLGAGAASQPRPARPPASRPSSGSTPPAPPAAPSAPAPDAGPPPSGSGILM